jgi:signal transduction histidine kinase/ActR/RegA family two-component response regulator
LDRLSYVNATLAGFFAFAAIHYAIKWLFSRSERVLAIFSMQCLLYTAFSALTVWRSLAATIPDVQFALDWSVSMGVLGNAATLELMFELGGRRNARFRTVVAGVLVFLAVLNLWMPLRGTVLALEPMPLPGGDTGLLPIRTPPTAFLHALYVAVVAIEVYAFVVAHRIWRRDRLGAVLVALGATAISFATVVGILIDYAKVRAPYVGSSPIALLVLCMAVVIAREYAARGARVAATERELRAHQEHLEDVVATRTRELSEAKEEAERANKAKSDFLAHMSHEIRSPLHVMLGYLQMLERETSLTERPKKKIEAVHSSGKHLLTLINDILEMSKIEAGRHELVEDEFDPWSILDEVEKMFSGQSASKGIELTLARAESLPRGLVGDAGKMKQILINLVGNAVKFTKTGSIRVSASASAQADGSIVGQLAVADTGPGVAADDLARMFQPFEQSAAGTRAGGTGLGLAISLAYARLMGGDLTAESELGRGTTFRFTFKAKPVAPSALTGPGSAHVLGNRSKRCKVLIVDDIPINRDVLSELFSQPSFETRAAEDGTGALSLNAHWEPDVILIDLRMPGMGGIEAIRRMRAGGSTAAIGALSASALAEDEREALAVGADFFLRKPYDDRQLLERIARALKTRGEAGPAGVLPG